MGIHIAQILPYNAALLKFSLNGINMKYFPNSKTTSSGELS